MKNTFDRIYDDYHQELYRFVFYMVKDKETTEDLVQEVYIRILKSWDSFRRDSSEKTWIFSIARHVTIDYFRSQKRKSARFLEFFDWGEKGDSIPTLAPLPEEIAEKNEDTQKLYAYLDKCTVDQRSVLILRFIHDFSIKETSEALGFSESKVKTTQHRALKTLKKYWLNDLERGESAL